MTTDRTPESGSSSRSWLIAMVATLGTWTYSFTWNTVGVALPHMKGTFSATNDQVSWVMISFVVGSAIMTASIGWLSGKFGRRQLFLFCTAGFCVSLVGCATATTLEAEVFWRFIQGVSGAPLIAVGQIIAVSAFPPEKYSMATSFWALGFVTGNVVAPTIGGHIIDHHGWPWIYYVNIPLCLLVIIAGLAVIPRTPKSEERLDWFGFITLIVGVAVLQFMLARGERLDWFESSEIIICTLVSVLLLYLFTIHTITGQRTFFDRQLFLNYNFVLGQLYIFVIGAAIYMPLLLLPLMLQQISNYPSQEIGNLLLARGVGSVIGLIFMSKMREKLDPRPIMIVGLICNIIPSWEMAHWSSDIAAREIIWTNFLAGIGAGLVWAPLNKMVLSKLKGKLQDQGFAMFYLNFDLGYAVGTSIIIGMHARHTQANYSVISSGLTPFNQSLQYPDIQQGWSLNHVETLLSLQAEVSRQATMIAYNNSFLICAWLMIILIPFCYMFKNTWLPETRPNVSGEKIHIDEPIQREKRPGQKAPDQTDVA
jgi:DHA2 family multidrug resistance protein